MDEYLEMKKLALRKAKDILFDEKFIECMTLERMETAAALIMDALQFQKRCDRLAAKEK